MQLPFHIHFSFLLFFGKSERIKINDKQKKDEIAYFRVDRFISLSKKLYVTIGQQLNKFTWNCVVGTNFSKHLNTSKHFESDKVWGVLKHHMHLRKKILNTNIEIGEVACFP